jgi:CRISPR/Cas system CMR subunit Cmr4 (Cas7 group RAMP superfamily)
MSTIYLTRLIIQTQTPMAINTGRRETGFDTQLVRDANGLPYIPATSIAGVWRSLVKNNFDEEAATFWFGNTDKSSMLTIADGVLHDSKNQPVQGLKTFDEIEQDKLLSLLYQDRPHHRERVRVNDRGVAADEAKFDQLLLPAGVRFCVDIQWHDLRLGESDVEKTALQWLKILQCWQHRYFALGATTRNGLGQIKVIASKQQTVDLKDGPKTAQLLRTFAQRAEIPTEEDLPQRPQDKPFASLPLKAIDHWRCGAGTELLGDDKPDHTVAQISYSERSIVWQDNQGRLSAKPIPILCGSSIKGMLAHRVAFHLRRFTGQWAENSSTDTHEQWQTRPDELKTLFGLADDKVHDNSQAGCLFVDDCEIEYKNKTSIRQHTSIDRFTGGVRQGALYNEELLYQPEFTLKLWLAPKTELSPNLKKALTVTLNDLKLGLLPFGAGSGRGTSLVSAHAGQNWMVDDINETGAQEVKQ